MIIRKMKSVDLHSVVRLSKQLGYECTFDELENRFKNLVDDETSALLVGEISDQVIAFLHVHENRTLLAGLRAELHSLVVDHEFRNKGYGKLLLGAVEDWMRTRELSKLRLGSRTSRVEAHAFYKSYGFNIEKEWLVFSKVL